MVYPHTRDGAKGQSFHLLPKLAKKQGIGEDCVDEHADSIGADTEKMAFISRAIGDNSVFQSNIQVGCICPGAPANTQLIEIRILETCSLQYPEE